MRSALLFSVMTLAAASALAAPTARGFEANRGQLDPRADFVWRAGDQAVFIGRDGFVIAQPPAALGVQVVDAAPGRRVVGEAPLPGRLHDLSVGGVRDVPLYGRVVVEGLLPGVDLRWHQEAGALEYDFHVQPGADAGSIRLALQGATSARVRADGALEAVTPGGPVVQRAPVAWQEVAGARVPVAARWAARGEAWGFELGAVDARYPLVIDPIVEYGTWLGGSASDAVQDVAVGPDGDLYVTGFTTSIDFPFTLGGAIAPAFQAPPQAKAFVTRLRPGADNGPDSLIYSAFIGSPAGEGAAFGAGVDVDAAGNAYVVGVTSSLLLPTVGGLGPMPTDHNNAFLAKLDATGTTLLFMATLGGLDVDELRAVDAGDDGVVVVAGRTASVDFPTVGAYQPGMPNRLFQALVMRIDTTQAGPGAILYSTLYGGGASEDADAVAVDAAGRIYITGSTASYGSALAVPLPVTPNAFQANNAGGRDGFVAVFDPSLTGAASFVFGSYLGGQYAENDTVFHGGIGVDSAGRAYVTGTTQSPNFPTKAAYDSTLNTGSLAVIDAYVACVDPFAADPADSLVWSTYLGGATFEDAYDLTIDANGDVVVVGQTVSADFPRSPCSPAQKLYGDAFVTRFSPAGELLFSTTLGGNGYDRFFAVAPTGTPGVLALAGDSASTNAPVSANAWQPAPAHAIANNFRDGWVVQLADLSCPAPPTPVDDAYAIVSGGTLTVALPGVLANDTDPNGDGLIAELVDDVAHGTLTLADDGSFVYAPTPGFVGTDGFTYLARDPGGLEGTAAVTIEVTPPSPTQPACTTPAQPDELACLVAASLAPAFHPAVTDYTVIAPSDQVLVVTATLADPALSLYIGGNPAVSGQPVNAWAPAGGHIDVAIYDGWTEVNRYTLAVAAPPAPEPDDQPALLALDIPGLSPAFDPAIATYTVPAPAGGEGFVPVTATLGNPANMLHIQSTPVASGQTWSAWTQAGSTISVVVYDPAWQVVAAYTIAVEP